MDTLCPMVDMEPERYTLRDRQLRRLMKIIFGIYRCVGDKMIALYRRVFAY